MIKRESRGKRLFTTATGLPPVDEAKSTLISAWNDDVLRESQKDVDAKAIAKLQEHAKRLRARADVCDRLIREIEDNES